MRFFWKSLDLFEPTISWLCLSMEDYPIKWPLNGENEVPNNRMYTRWQLRGIAAIHATSETAKPLMLLSSQLWRHRNPCYLEGFAGQLSLYFSVRVLTSYLVESLPVSWYSEHPETQQENAKVVVEATKYVINCFSIYCYNPALIS